MKKLLSFIAIMFLVGTMNAQAQEKKFSVYAIGFYNLENLFDTCHDEGHNDYEYLPEGRNKWTGMKYTHKLRNMARVLADMGTDKLVVPPLESLRSKMPSVSPTSAIRNP